MLRNLLGNDGATAPDAPHADVAQGVWYSNSVNWAVENGYMNGYGGTDRFGVGDALAREQFVCVIANAAGADFEAIDSTSIDGFLDAGRCKRLGSAGYGMGRFGRRHQRRGDRGRR